ncbi:MAG: hypothetical protein Q9172_006758 [Xanthocarpia lactea]
MVFLREVLASADGSGRILVRRLEPPSSGKDEWGVFKLIDKRIGEAIKELSFHAQDGLLLVAGRSTAFVMYAKSKVEVCRACHPDHRKGLWINHPTSPSLLIKVDALQARLALSINVKQTLFLLLHIHPRHPSEHLPHLKL